MAVTRVCVKMAARDVTGTYRLPLDGRQGNGNAQGGAPAVGEQRLTFVAKPHNENLN